MEVNIIEDAFDRLINMPDEQFISTMKEADRKYIQPYFGLKELIVAENKHKRNLKKKCRFRQFKKILKWHYGKNEDVVNRLFWAALNR